MCRYTYTVRLYIVVEVPVTCTIAFKVILSVLFICVNLLLLTSIKNVINELIQLFGYDSRPLPLHSSQSTVAGY